MANNTQIIGIIGYGQMGRAFKQGLSQSSRSPVLVYDRSAGALTELDPAERATSAAEVLERADLTVLAVKPQQLTELVTDLKGEKPTGIVLSILAGTPLSRIEQALGTNRIVRAMPNMAAFVGESVTGWVCSSGVTTEDRVCIRTVLSAIGQEIELDDEAAIDGLTAISGSGTGYVMAFAEALSAAAQSVGFESEAADELVRQTMVGAGKLLAHDDRSFTELKQAVTSKGGTTEAALRAMPEAELSAVLQRAVHAAVARAQEIGTQS